jgi:hypothetical protein
LLGPLVLGAGCAKDRHEPTFPVQGQVLVKGKPAAGAVVLLVPLARLDDPEALKPRGITDGEGKFRLTTYERGDGAPAGEYAVTVRWPKRTKSALDEDDGRARLGPPPDVLGGRYSNPKRSSLTLTIQAGENFLPPLQLR